MGAPNLVPIPADGDWPAVRRAIQTLAARLGPGGAPHFAGLDVDVLSVDSLTIPGLSGVLQATVGVLSGSAPHSALGSIGANDHHNQAHVLNGADHTVSGLTPGHVLKALTATTFGFAAAPDVGFANPMTTYGDMIAGDLDGLPVPLPIGNEGEVLTVDSGYPAWTISPGKSGGREIINTLLGSFITLDHTGAAFHLLVDGVVDALESEAGVDTVNSTDEIYSASDDWYTPAGTGSTIDVSQESENFNGAVGDIGGVEYRHATSFQASGAITCPQVSLYMGATTGSPSGNFTVRIETDNAGVPSGTLVHADATKSLASITDSAWNVFAFPSAISLSASTTYWLVTSIDDQSSNVRWVWRLKDGNPYVGGVAKRSVDSGATWAVLGAGVYDGAFRLYKSIPVDMVLISNGFTAKTANPATARLVIVEVNDNTPTLNTDIKGWVSRDSGSTWTQITLADRGAFSTTQNIYYGSATISGQPAGSTVKWKITTHNNKTFYIRGVGLVWE